MRKHSTDSDDVSATWRQMASPHTLVAPYTPLGSRRHAVVDHRPLGRRIGVAAFHERPIGFLLLVAGDRGATAGEDHPFAARILRRLQHIARTDDVGLQQLVPRVAFTGLGGKMHDHVLALERWSNRCQVREIGLDGGHAFHRAPIQCDQTRPRR